MSGLAFKIQDSPGTGTITYMRVYQGKLGKSDAIMNMASMKRSSPKRLMRMHSAKTVDVDQVSAGDIVAVTGINCASGTTFTGAAPITGRKPALHDRFDRVFACRWPRAVDVLLDARPGQCHVGFRSRAEQERHAEDARCDQVRRFERKSIVANCAVLAMSVSLVHRKYEAEDPTFRCSVDEETSEVRRFYYQDDRLSQFIVALAQRCRNLFVHDWFSVRW